MPTNITQVEDLERGKTILRIEGEMFLEDALLLEKIALEMREESQKNLTLDFSDLHFLDSESAPVIKRLEREHKFTIVGMEFFLQNIINQTENKNF